jgi:plastocyanin
MRTGFLLLMLVPVLVILAGCGGSLASAQVPAVQTNHVELPKSYRFDPAVIQVKAGDTVTWHNGDNFTHSVQVLKEGFTMVNLPPGETGTITFAQPGEYDYVCTYHTQQMKGKVIVAP